MEIKPDSSQHWYKADGTPAYDATLREARKENLLPSVTSVIKEKSKPNLEAWKQNQILYAALTLPRLPDERLDDFVKRVIADSRDQAAKAAEWGERVHALIEKYLVTKMYAGSIDPEMDKYMIQVISWIDTNIKKVIAVEKCAASVAYGYGCRLDMVVELASIFEDAVLIDVKTTKTKPGEKIEKYPEWSWQLAANAMAVPEYNIKRYCNLVVSSTEPGRIELVEWSDDDIMRGWEVFRHLLAVFRLSRKFDYAIKS